MKTNSPVYLYIGCLPKRAKEHEIEQFFESIDIRVEVELAHKRNRRFCRGHGKIICNSEELANIVMQGSFFLYGRTLVIERILSDKELVDKYNSLSKRKLKIVIPCPVSLNWSNEMFIMHFRTFGELDIAHLKEEPIIYQGNKALVGNLTYKLASSVRQVTRSKA